MELNCFKSPEEKNILWSLKPVLMYTKISGIPTYDASENKSCTYRILGYFWFILSLTCLFLNCFFQIFNFVEDMKKRYVCGFSIFDSLKYFPFAFADLLGKSYSKPFFVTGVPLVFALQFYFTGKFQKIVGSVKQIENKMLLSDRFYRKCRKACYFSMAVSLLVN